MYVILSGWSVSSEKRAVTNGKEGCHGATDHPLTWSRVQTCLDTSTLSSQGTKKKSTRSFPYRCSSPPRVKDVCACGSCPPLSLGKSWRGLTNGGLSPKFSEKIGGNPTWKIGPFQGNWDFFRAYRRLFGADRDQSLRNPQPRGKSRNCPERALLGPIGAFRAKPPFAKPPFGFPRLVALRFASANNGDSRESIRRKNLIL